MKVTSRKLFFLACATAIALIPILNVSASPEPANPGGVADATLVTLIATVGDDVFSTADVASLIDPTGSNATQHYGPYASGSPDSGTCGNNWAEDTFDRHFTVHTAATGLITVVEQFKNGSFTTKAGQSPAACETDPARMVNGGLNGSMHGYFIIPLPTGTMQTSNDPSCVVSLTPMPCTTAGFIDTHFTPCYGTDPVGCSANTFFDHYVATDQSLIEHEWKNASADRGGNSGDIRNT
jgi:hypothetical protein